MANITTQLVKSSSSWLKTQSTYLRTTCENMKTFSMHQTHASATEVVFQSAVFG